MKNKEKSYSIKSILINDYASFASWVFPTVIFIMALFIEVFGFFPDLKRGRAPLTTEAIPFFIQFGIIVLIIGLVIISLRVVRFKKFFENGIEVEGEVTDLWKYRDRGRIYFTFTYKDLKCDNSNSVHFNNGTKRFLPHTKVRILFKRENYFKAIIKDLFV
ncbi:MAG TPA: hypothetical protein VJH92_05270 [Candidatus Nanoarchaeia archaeon]|nr:hypothetical protein [Candidatus Nanoarchaeia archaeon]